MSAYCHSGRNNFCIPRTKHTTVAGLARKDGKICDDDGGNRLLASLFD